MKLGLLALYCEQYVFESWGCVGTYIPSTSLKLSFWYRIVTNWKSMLWEIELQNVMYRAEPCCELAKLTEKGAVDMVSLEFVVVGWISVNVSLSHQRTAIPSINRLERCPRQSNPSPLFLLQLRVLRPGVSTPAFFPHLAARSQVLTTSEVRSRFHLDVEFASVTILDSSVLKTPCWSKRIACAWRCL